MDDMQNRGSINKFKLFRLVWLAGLFLQIAVATGQPNSIEQDPGSSSGSVQSALLSNQNLQPLQKLQIPENLIRIQKITVPDLIGRNFNAAELTAILEEEGLQLGEVVAVADNQNAGFVRNQYPPAGRSVNLQTKINLTYGIEVIQDIVTVPQYVGLTVDRAVARMPNDRLIPGEISEINSAMPPGTVVEQFPEAGLQVDPETHINLNFSNGVVTISQVRVPLLVGFSLQEAARRLRKSGLFAGQIVAEPSTGSPGIVIRQSPEPTTYVDVNSTVNITFSEPLTDESVTVPNVIGLPKDEAILVLKESDLRYAQQFVHNTNRPVGMVTGQDVPPGKKVAPGTMVIIQIQDKSVVPPWLFWAGGILIAGIAGAFIGRKINSGRKRTPVKTKLKLKLVWDSGVQTLSETDVEIQSPRLNLKFIPDKGIQTFKID